MGEKSAPELIELAVTRFQDEVPALKKLKLIFGLELRGGRDIQLYRVELPGPKISKDLRQDERIQIELERKTFNFLAEKGTLPDYRKAAESGQIRFQGDGNVQKLVERVVERHEQRSQVRKAH